MKIKVRGYHYPPVDTAVSDREWAIFPEQLGIKELAQLFVDLWTLPQPTLRSGEAENLAKIVYLAGYERIGSRFNRLAARQLISFS